MKQLLRITKTYGKSDADGYTDEVIITSQKELEEAIEENTWREEPWGTSKFGEEGCTSANLSGSGWDEPTGVDFQLLNIATAIAELEKKKVNIDREIKEYKLLEVEKDRKLKSLYLCLENVVKSYDDRHNKSNGKNDFETNIEMARELLKEVSDE